MKTSPVLLAAGRSTWLDRIVDYVELTKPRIGLLVLATVATGGFAAAHGSPDLATLCHVLIGTGLVAAGSAALNQWWERDVDGRMLRTAQRPLPSGRVAATEALWFGSSMSVAGIAYLLAADLAVSALVALASSVLYLGAYTPLKRRTALNTVVGAVAGALPPMIGWSAVTDGCEPAGWTLVAIVFFWQFPHFWAIAWLYRRDYAQCGLRMLPTSALGQRLVGLATVSYLLALLPASLSPSLFHVAGPTYFWGALASGLGFLAYGARFAIRPTDERARRLLWASLVYLPTVLALLWFDLVRY
jgi:protoheme IX farnesyltransferase